MLQQFTRRELQFQTLKNVKEIYLNINCNVEVADKRAKDNWVEAILRHQSAQIELVAVAEIKIDEQAVAQKELETHIIDQAETVAPEITTVEISFYDHEVYALGKQIASITHDPDDFQTQRWVVMVGETEVHRADAWAKCHSYITWHYKQGTLPTALPVATESSCLGGEIHHLEMEPSEVIELTGYKLNHGDAMSPDVIEIDSDYDPDFGTLYRVWGGSVGINLLGTFYQAAAEKWVAQPCDSDDRPRCNTPAEAQLLIVAAAFGSQLTNITCLALAGLRASDSGDYAVDLLDKPFDELTVADWETIKQQAQQAELVAA